MKSDPCSDCHEQGYRRLEGEAAILMQEDEVADLRDVLGGKAKDLEQWSKHP